MKLYLKFQCEARALEVHETLENIVEKKEERLYNVQKTRQKNYEKKLKGEFLRITRMRYTSV